MTTLAQAKDYISVWVSQGDFGALGICNCAPDCDDSIHVLFSLRLDVVHKLWKMGRGRTQSGAPRLAPDGRLVLAPGGAAVMRHHLNRYSVACVFHCRRHRLPLLVACH